MDDFLFPQRLVIGVPFGILREPALENAFLLEKHLVDGPEAGKGESAQNGGDDRMPDEKGSAGAKEADDQPDPPALFAPMILHLDDGGVADSYAQEDGCPHDDTAEIHLRACSTIIMMQI